MSGHVGGDIPEAGTRRDLPHGGGADIAANLEAYVRIVNHSGRPLRLEKRHTAEGLHVTVLAGADEADELRAEVARLRAELEAKG